MSSGTKILITGATGQVARPIAEALAKENEVWCAGRFTDVQARAALEAQGIETVHWDMGVDDPDALPDDFSHVLHAAFLRDTDDFEAAMQVNCVGTATLMSHCRGADAFLYVSSFGVYKAIAPDHSYAETDPIGGHTPWMPAYAPAKIASEGLVRGLAHTLQLPTTIARLNVAYGPAGHGGVPIRFLNLMRAGEPIAVPRDSEDWQSPIHTDDLARQVPLLWDVAAIDPPTIVNWAGDDVVSVREMMQYISDITGVPVSFQPSDVSRNTFVSDNTRRRGLIGDCQIEWRAGVRRTVDAHFPGLVANDGT
jgi:nucleoside-diphosphate-sugar epimerase